ncbi:MAG: hypothetical protein HeimC3_41010 [Candidatus Heimdallarchaeota archaeon LC_3]|nr:MAG: hypothetical protein HeimC3_41010 [Candidatus Heimdallarchaeota archaeon LC_3]
MSEEKKVVDLTKRKNTRNKLFEEQSTRILKLEKKIAELEVELLNKTLVSLSDNTREIQAPYVSYKIDREESKNPKTRTTIKVSGALEELKMVDVEIRLNELRAKLKEHFDHPVEEIQ